MKTPTAQTSGSLPRTVRRGGDPHYWPTDWTAQCEARCRKSGKQCPHRCNTQIPSTIAGHCVLDEKYFQVSGRPARLCASHARSWYSRAKRLQTLALIEGGHISPFNKYGYGSIIIAQDRLNFDGEERAMIPKMWGIIGWSGNVPEGLLQRLPHYPSNS